MVCLAIGSTLILPMLLLPLPLPLRLPLLRLLLFQQGVMHHPRHLQEGQGAPQRPPATRRCSRRHAAGRSSSQAGRYGGCTAAGSCAALLRVCAGAAAAADIAVFAAALGFLATDICICGLSAAACSSAAAMAVVLLWQALVVQLVDYT
jgi:hypothetical protein